MFGQNLDDYDEPVGPWGQRIAGLLLLGAVVLAAWYSVSSVLEFWNAKGHGDPIAISLVVLAVTPWFGFVGMRLLTAQMTRTTLLPPLGLISAGALLLVGTVWWALSAMWTDHASVGRGLLGGLTVGGAAIGSGFRKYSRSAAVPPDA